MTAQILPLRRKPRDHHWDMLAAAIAIDPRPFTQAEMKLNGDLAAHLDQEFQRDPEFKRRAEESM